MKNIPWVPYEGKINEGKAEPLKKHKADQMWLVCCWRTWFTFCMLVVWLAFNNLHVVVACNEVNNALVFSIALCYHYMWCVFLLDTDATMKKVIYVCVYFRSTDANMWVIFVCHLSIWYLSRPVCVLWYFTGYIKLISFSYLISIIALHGHILDISFSYTHITFYKWNLPTKTMSDNLRLPPVNYRWCLFNWGNIDCTNVETTGDVCRFTACQL
jgi:hypothetical protein